MASPLPHAASSAAPLLAVRDLQAWYGESHILHGVAFDVAPGEVVTLLGRNGAGKTTTLKSIMGVIGKRKGSISFARECPPMWDWTAAADASRSASPSFPVASMHFNLPWIILRSFSYTISLAGSAISRR